MTDHTLHIDERHVTTTGPLQYVTDASTLGWPAGYWPASLTTTLGNGRDLLRSRNANVLFTDYFQPSGGITLRVFND